MSYLFLIFSSFALMSSLRPLPTHRQMMLRPTSFARVASLACAGSFSFTTSFQIGTLLSKQTYPRRIITMKYHESKVTKAEIITLNHHQAKKKINIIKIISISQQMNCSHIQLPYNLSENILLLDQPNKSPFSRQSREVGHSKGAQAACISQTVA